MNLKMHDGLQYLLHESDLELTGTLAVWLAFVSLIAAAL
jgi:hypothetical protein